jgi:hypothetical protein
MTVYLVVGINKPLACLYQHEPQPGLLTNYILKILLFVEKNLLEPPCRARVYLSQPPVWPSKLRRTSFRFSNHHRAAAVLIITASAIKSLKSCYRDVRRD